MNEFIYALMAVIIVSSISLVGIFTISLKENFLNKITLIFVAFASGSLLGSAFFDILPEVANEGKESGFFYVLSGIVIFFAMERYIHWHHCHSGNCEGNHHPMTYLNLIGDMFHNFIDGSLVAAAFLTSVPTGVITSFAIIAHEIPQEISDFAILVHGGMERKKALLFNFISSLTAILGVFATFLFAKNMAESTPIILAIAGGGFIYIATVDLMPEIHKETKESSIIIQSLALLAGIAMIGFLISFFPE